MPLNARVKKTGNQFQKLVQQIKKIDKESVQVGHFREQGLHPSGFTYAQLMAIHHNGGNPSGNTPLPPRPVLDILFFKNQQLTDPKFKNAFKAWKKRSSNDSSDEMLLEDIGRILREKEKAIFGSSELAPNAVPPKSTNNPLIDTGALKSKVAYKTSTGKQVKEG